MTIEASSQIKSPEEVSKDAEILGIFSLSYFYSQTDHNGQQAMLEWLIAKGYVIRDDILSRREFLLSNLKTPGLHIKQRRQVMESSISSELDSLEKAHLSEISLREHERTILIRMIERDQHYQEKIRSNRPDNLIRLHEPDSQQDKHASFLRKYVLMEHPAGHPGYEALFKTVHQNVQLFLVQDEPDTNVEYRELMHLSELWEGNHPGHAFFPS